MTTSIPSLDLLKDDLGDFMGKGPAFVTFGEVMVRETPADMQRPERTNLVHLSMAGSEYSLAIGLSRLGIPSAYITRVPDNPYGRAVQSIARGQGVNTDHIVWAPKTEPIGRLIYESGRTPRRDVGIYQRMFSAASRLDSGMVNWKRALKDARLFHTSGITIGLAAHSRYNSNPNLEAFKEAIASKPAECLIGLDFNYRGTLWSIEQARPVMTPLVTEHVDVLITTIEDMALLFDLPFGQYSAKQVVDGDIDIIEDDDMRAFAQQILEMFRVRVVAITIRYPDSFEAHRWESAAMNAEGALFRSPKVRRVTLLDRLGGGDTWNAGFYYGLLTAGLGADGLAKGVMIGDAFTLLKQTLMFDLPIVDKGEVADLLRAHDRGGGKRTQR